MPVPTSWAEVGLAKVNYANGVLDAYIGVMNKTIKGKHGWSSNVIKNSQGFWAGEDARDEHIIITVDFHLTAASKALAIANGAFLRPLAEVTISGADLPWINTTGQGGFYTGPWCYHEGASIDLSAEQPGGTQIMLRKFADPTQNAQQFVIPT